MTYFAVCPETHGMSRDAPEIERGITAFARSSNDGLIQACPQLAKAEMRPLKTGSGFDPSPTLAVHCGSGFDARFEPYQRPRLSRYNAGR
jgi:hypothetical protein